jgi:hypothetical protein
MLISFEWAVQVYFPSPSQFHYPPPKINIALAKLRCYKHFAWGHWELSRFRSRLIRNSCISLRHWKVPSLKFSTWSKTARGWRPSWGMSAPVSPACYAAYGLTTGKMATSSSRQSYLRRTFRLISQCWKPSATISGLSLNARWSTKRTSSVAF